MTTVARPSAAWRDRAACVGQDTELWFAKRRQAAPAVAVCARCPVRAECLYDAITQEATGYPPYGIRGGLTPRRRRGLRPLAKTAPDLLAALRTVLDDHDAPHPIERPAMTTAPSTPPAEAPALAAAPEPETARTASPSESLPIGRLLAWADGHGDQEIRDQSARARLVLAALRRRYDTDKERAAITTEAEQLEKRLAELRAREAELAPAKPKRKAAVRDYDTRTVRAWAAEHGVDCPPVGQIPKRVLDAWRASASQAG